MTPEKIIELFKKYDDCYLKSDDICDRRSRKLDINAFLILDDVLKYDNDSIIYGAEHEKIYLCNVEDIGDISEEQIADLIRCGVIFNDSDNWLYMYV